MVYCWAALIFITCGSSWRDRTSTVALRTSATPWRSAGLYFTCQNVRGRRVVSLSSAASLKKPALTERRPLSAGCYGTLARESMVGRIVRRRIWARYVLCAVSIPFIVGLLSGLGRFRIYASPRARQADAAPKNTQSDTGLTLRVYTSLVLIPVSVTDAQNRFVLGLQKKDFQLFEDAVQQDIATFSGEDAPLSVGLVFDESGSMDYKLQTSRDATLEFLKFMNRDADAFLVEFSDAAKISVGFTAQTAEIQTALTHVQPGGLTAMLDGINVALQEMKKAKNPRKAIVIISDGGDNHSRYTAAEIESLVREADVQIYAMGVFDPVFSLGLSPEEISGPRLLSEIATQTGGRAFAAAMPNDLPAVTARIAVELRNQYVLGYYSKNRARDGKYRHVEVKIAQPPGMSALKGHWRLGYYAPTQ
jgi:Ca-activated chloride channel homolog